MAFHKGNRGHMWSRVETSHLECPSRKNVKPNVLLLPKFNYGGSSAGVLVHYNLWVLVDIQEKFFIDLANGGWRMRLNSFDKRKMWGYIPRKNLLLTRLQPCVHCFWVSRVPFNKAIGSIHKAQHKKLTTISATQNDNNLLLSVWGAEILWVRSLLARQHVVK